MSALRRAATWLAGLVVVALLGLVAVRWVDSAAVPVVVAQSAVPVMGLVGVVALAVLAALARRRWVTAAAVLAVLGLVAALVAPLRRSTVPAGDDDLTVVASNLELGRGSTADVFAQARRVDADLVVLVEVTPEALHSVDPAARAEWPHIIGNPHPGASGLLVLSRGPIEPIDWGEGNAQPWSPATGRVTTASGPVVVRGVHTHAPNLAEADRWRRSMGELAAWSQGRHRDEPVLMAGDLNAGPGHPAFRAAADGYTSATAARGLWWPRTWPVGRRYPAFTQLDHVLVRGLDVVDAGLFPVHDTDHAGVWARLRHR